MMCNSGTLRAINALGVNSTGMYADIVAATLIGGSTTYLGVIITCFEHDGMIPDKEGVEERIIGTNHTKIELD